MNLTALLIAFGWKWLLVPVGIWLLNGLRKALLHPWIRFLDFSETSLGVLVTVVRQEHLPPWRQLTETYLLPPEKDAFVTREVDGYVCSYEGKHSALGRRLRAAFRVAKARKMETDGLVS